MCIRAREPLRASLTLASSFSSSDQLCSSSNLCSPFLMCNFELHRRLPQLNRHAFSDFNRPTYTSEIGTAFRSPTENFRNYFTNCLRALAFEYRSPSPGCG